MPRHIAQVRPKHEQGAFPYAPQRDLANIYLPLFRETVTGMDEQFWDDHWRYEFEQAGITENDLGETVRLFSESLAQFIRNPEVDSPHKAFELTGFLDTPRQAREFLFSRLGAVVTGGFFVGIRDVTLGGVPSPVQGQMVDAVAESRAVARDMATDVDMIAAGRKVAHVVSGHPDTPQTEKATDVDYLQVELEETKRTLQQSHTRTQQQMEKIAELEGRLNFLRPVRDIAAELPGLRYWKRVSTVVRLAWQAYKSFK